MLFKILHADPILLNDFIVGAETELEDIDGALHNQVANL